MKFKINIHKNPAHVLLAEIKNMHDKAFPLSGWHTGYVEEFFLQQVRMPILATLEKDGMVCGFVMGKMLKEKNEFLIHSFLVVENMRGNGLGKELMQKTLNFVVKYTQVESVRVRFRESNSVGKFYAKMGFTDLNVCGKYKNGEQKLSLHLKRENIKDNTYEL
jgi:predicted GNAT family N-acyltransferase